MYLRYDYQTGEALTAYNIPVPKPYIEITEEKYDEIKAADVPYFVVNGKLTKKATRKYILKQRLPEIEKELVQADVNYEEKLNTPITYINGNQYKPVWVDDGTYSKLITGMQAGLVQFPQNIWDATKKAENMVSMSAEDFLQLVGFLAVKQNEFFEERKNLQSDLINEREEILKELN